jgi:hypothetical protein
MELKKSTAVIVSVGPFVSNSDGVTPVDSYNVSSAEQFMALKADGAQAVLSTASWAPITSADGYFELGIAAGITDTEGELSIIIQDEDMFLPVKRDYSVVTSGYWEMKYGADIIADHISSLDVRVQSLDIEVGSIGVEVGSVQTGINTLPTSGELNDHIATLPTSATLEAQINTLPTSQTLNAHIITLPLSENVADVKAVVDTLPSSTMVDANFDTVDASLATLPTSAELNDHILTLPTSTHVSDLTIDVGSIAP